VGCNLVALRPDRECLHGDRRGECEQLRARVADGGMTIRVTVTGANEVSTQQVTSPQSLPVP
jgi:hypothetical protein